MKQRLSTTIRNRAARFGYNAQFNVADNSQLGVRSGQVHQGRRVSGRELATDGRPKTTAAYLALITQENLTAAGGDQAEADRRIADQLSQDAKTGVRAFLKGAVVVGATVLVGLVIKDMSDNNGAETSVEGGLIALGLGKLALGSGDQIHSVANPADVNPTEQQITTPGELA